MLKRLIFGVILAAASGAVSAQPRRAPPAPTDFRLHARVAPASGSLLAGPLRHIRTGFGGGMVDVFPSEQGALHLSAGGRISGADGRLNPADPERRRLLTGARDGVRRLGEPAGPAMLLGVGRPSDLGMSLGVDTGMAMGRLEGEPLRMGRGGTGPGPRSNSGDGRVNPLGRVTMLYRF